MIDIQIWTPEHPRWTELVALVAELGQQEWFEASYEWHISAHVLAALKDDRLVGLLRYVIQAIGEEEDRPPFTLDGKTLLEAKVLAFTVPPDDRRQGIGRALQERLIVEARKAGLYQVRSYSSDENVENHMLKAALGFAIHPLPSGMGKDGVYFVYPIQRILGTD